MGIAQTAGSAYVCFMSVSTIDPARLRLAVAGVATLIVFAGAFAIAQFPSDADARKKVNRRVGVYQGAVETGGKVSFRITKKLRVVEFRATNVPQRCYTEPLVDPATQEQPKGTVTFGAPTMKLDKGGKFSYVNFPGYRPGLQPGPYREIMLKGKPTSGTKFEGKVFLHTANGNTDVPGTEVCTTGEPDWTASKLAKR